MRGSNIYHIDDIGKLCFLALSSPFPLCCTDAELKLDNSVMLKTRFRPTADLDSQTGILMFRGQFRVGDDRYSTRRGPEG